MKELNKIIIYLFIFCGVFVLFSSLGLLKTNSEINKEQSFVKIDAHEFKVEIADTSDEWQQGLSGRKSLCIGCGMLFVFPNKQVKEFWMKDMNFPLDIVWIADNKVVGVEKAVPAPKNDELPVVVKSPEGVNMVLEINAYESNLISNGSLVKTIIN